LSLLRLLRNGDKVVTLLRRALASKLPKDHSLSGLNHSYFQLTARTKPTLREFKCFKAEISKEEKEREKSNLSDE